MFLAIAVENKKHPLQQNNYRVWYLELGQTGEVVNIGVKSKEELIKSLFLNYKETGKSNWKAFLKGSDQSTSIDAMDFVGKNNFENTHFGNLPTLSEFNQTIKQLNLNFEVRAIAS